MGWRDIDHPYVFCLFSYPLGKKIVKNIYTQLSCWFVLNNSKLRFVPIFDDDLPQIVKSTNKLDPKLRQSFTVPMIKRLSPKMRTLVTKGGLLLFGTRPLVASFTKEVKPR